VSADAQRAAGTRSTAWARCGTAVAAQSFEFQARTRCTAKGYQRPTGSGTQTEVAFVEGGTQAVAADSAALVGRYLKVPGCKEIAAVPLHVAGESGRDQGIVGAAAAQ